METRGRSGGFGFVDDNGSLPGAMCSSQGQSEDEEEANKASSDMGIFDVLLTTAGRLLQEGENNEWENGNTEMQEFMAKNVVEQKGGNFQSNGAPSMCVLFDENSLEDDESCKREEVTDLSIVQKNIINKSSLYKRPKNSVSLMQKESLEEKDPIGRAGEGLLHSSVCCQNVESACSIKISNYMSIGELTKVCGVDSCGMSKENHLSPAVPAGADSSVLEHGFVNMHIVGKGKDEGSDTCSSHSKAWIKQEEGSCMTVRDSLVNDENPLLVSSGSSEEDRSCVKDKPCDTFSQHPLEKKLESRQVVARSTARDDDDNCSESFVPEVTIKRSSRASLPKALRARKLPNGSARGKKNAAGSKRKHAELNDITNEKWGSLYGNAMACSRQQTPRRSRSKKKIYLGSTCMAGNLNVDINNLSSLDFPNANLYPPASVVKVCSAQTASVAFSPNSATKLSWNHPVEKSNPHAELRITSFTVPEFSVDLPETATLATLKRTVMEAAINLLGGGLNVQVLLQGKKVPDESATLFQLGITHPERLESLGFMLEPNQVPNSVANTEDPLLALSCTTSQPATRYTVFSLDGDVDASTIHTLDGTTTGLLKIDAADSTTIQRQAGLKDEDTLSHAQMQRNSDGIQVSKRRMRRPFTVSEVDALIQAVEMLGTGRWRDIKMQVFDQAKHRTYVDLKDKWKTLVHTAQIAPHQRRGETVPQELLDRVIQAHTYWAAHQNKEHEGLGLH